LEAVELGDAVGTEIGDRTLPTAVVARFGTKPEAARRGIDFGMESFEPLSCRLLSKH
jgi:hypothetical protein